MIYILMFCHVFFTLRLKFVQKYTLHGIKYSFSAGKSRTGIGTYRAFAAALGTTIGPGNIVGVGVAISAGGIGAIFWMWLCGVIAMATRYAESYLAISYPITVNGVRMGGTMSLLDMLGKRKTAVFWTLACALCGLLMGSAVPSSALSASMPFPPWLTGTLLSALTLVTVCFGVKGISRVCALLVPVMTLAFLAVSLGVIFMNASLIPETLTGILRNAFSLSAAAGGGIGAAMKSGITRGLYSNESGLGSGGVLAAESGDSDRVMSALAAMTTTFWDTVVMCAVTGVMFAVTGAQIGMDPGKIVTDAFSVLPWGRGFLAVSMLMFVFACVIGWYYIAKRSLAYLFKGTRWYDALFISATLLGAVIKADFLWSAADIANWAMLMPSLYTLLKMSDKIENINLYITHNK